MLGRLGDPEAVLGDVEIDVVKSEENDNSGEVTSHPVEEGADVSDHVKQSPTKLKISGVLGEPNASERNVRLKVHYMHGDTLDYVGRNVRKGVVIESYRSTHSKDVYNALKFELTLSNVRKAHGANAKIPKGDPAKG